MRDQEFKSKLTEVCEWEIPLTMESTQQGSRNRRRRLEQAGESCFNETFPPKIKNLLLKEKSCEDCGQTVKGRCVNIELIPGTAYKKERCQTCKKSKDPYTGKFTLTGSEASQKWGQYLRPVSRRYKPKALKPEPACIIRKYPETLDPL